VYVLILRAAIIGDYLSGQVLYLTFDFGDDIPDIQARKNEQG